VYLEFAKPEVEYFDLMRPKPAEHPHEMRLRIGVKYHQIMLHIDDRREIYDGGFYIMASNGFISLIGVREIKIRASIRGIWHPGKLSNRIEVISDPISLEEIYEIDRALGVGDIRLKWNINAYGFLEEEEASARGIYHVTPIFMSIASLKEFSVSRMDFVKHVLEPADLLRRKFIEVVVEPVDEGALNNISDPDIREGFRILLEKQRLLNDALEKLQRASNASEYRSVIEDVRKVVEGIVIGKPAGDKTAIALKKSFEILGIARETNLGALSDLVEKLSLNIIGKGSNKGFLYNIFEYSSSLGVHTTIGDKLYEARPDKHDAEFAVLQAMLVLNYIIKTLKKGASRI